ncbi:MAG: ABC transporter ATP-binding protein [Pseudomonadota bacterium]
MLLEVEDLSVSFVTRNGVQAAVKNVSYCLDQGQILGIVGESGSGKSVSCYSLLGLVPQPPARIDSGTALFKGEDLLSMSAARQREVRGDRIAMIFQDPMTSLNPFLTIGEQLLEPLVYHRACSRSDARARALQLLEEVGIADSERKFASFPHEFSGGMRQRVMIAMALITEPELLIADEPTTALDVTVQAQILKLIADLQTRRNIGVIFISHDLAVVNQLADHVLVMNQGEIVEQGPGERVLHHPQQLYTQTLVASTPRGAKLMDRIESAVNTESLLSVKSLSTSFVDHSTSLKTRVTAVKDVSFELYRGEILGLVGESGSGKSTLGRSILRLLNPDMGSVEYEGVELLDLDREDLMPYRQRMQMIFQDPFASLNPRMTIYDALAEPLLYHSTENRQSVHKAVLQLMDDVGLQRRFVRKYPHEFSGGQRQRIAIARALATEPEFIVADEPVSALDVTVQKQILELLLELVARRNLSMLFISHDLSVVRYLCDRVLVMRQASLVESGRVEEVWREPASDYTKQLLASAPVL